MPIRTHPLIGAGTRASVLAAATAVAACGYVLGRQARSGVAVPSPRSAEPDLRTLDDLYHERELLHELRATVAGLSTSYHLLHDSTDLPRQRRVRLDDLHGRELARLRRLLHDEADEPPCSVGLDYVVEPLVESLRLRGHEVVWPESSLRVLGRPDDIAQAVHILLENAVRHGDGPVVVKVTGRADVVEVRVIDHGPGVPVALGERVFERGVSGPDSPGEGIGLAVARRLARDGGGDLRLAPARPGGPGAEFVLSLAAGAGSPCQAAAS